MKNVLISGGTGMIGTRLSEILTQKGFKVSILTRNRNKSENPDYTYYIWDPAKGEIPDEAIQKADFVINLAGANIGGSRWTESYKKKIKQSRIESTRTIVNKINSIENNVKALYNASASGYYGFDRGEELLYENSGPGKDFLSDTCVAWENEALKLDQNKARTIIFRQGIVFSSRGGALAPLATTVKFFVGTTFGSGNFFMAWIHIDDLCEMIIWALQNEKIKGVFNAVSPVPIKNKTLIEALGNELHRPLIVPFLPESILKIMVGETAKSLLGSLKLSPEKIISAGFQFTYPELTKALHDIFEKKK